jgi:hypothetical protein
LHIERTDNGQAGEKIPASLILLGHDNPLIARLFGPLAGSHWSALGRMRCNSGNFAKRRPLTWINNAVIETAHY